MSRNPLTLGATEEFDYTLVDTENIDRTLINTEETDITSFIPLSHDTLPRSLFYEKYQTDNLWDPSRGLETFGEVVGLALDRNFFINALEKHLSYPLHTIPYFFSPFISTNAHIMAVNRRNRASSPQSVLWIDVEKIFDYYDRFQSDEQPYIYSLLKLVTDFEIPASKYKNRPFWEHEYLVLKRVPAEAIGVYELGEFDKVKNRFATPPSPVPQLPMLEFCTPDLSVYPFPVPPGKSLGKDPSKYKNGLLPRDLNSMSQLASFGPIELPELIDPDF